MKLRKGDRIVTSVLSDNIANVSGIIAHLRDCGRGDYMVFIADGTQHIDGKDLPAVNFESVNRLYVDVVERGCKCPELSHGLTERLDSCIDQAIARANEKHAELFAIADSAGQAWFKHATSKAEMLSAIGEQVRRFGFEAVVDALLEVNVRQCRNRGSDSSTLANSEQVFGGIWERIPELVRLAASQQAPA